jgi:ABC-type cobalamin/Fe3+-siderophores transport system ATPase subunit
MITELRLKNFRCFEDFSVEGLRPVTLLAGANSVGKTALLESIYLFCKSDSTSVFLDLRMFRDLWQKQLSPSILWEPLFANGNTSLELCVGVTLNHKSHEIVLRKDTSSRASSETEELEAEEDDNYSLELRYSVDNLPRGSEQFSLSKNGFTCNGDVSLAEDVPGVLLLYSTRMFSPAKAAKLLGKLKIDKQETGLIEILRMFDPRIQDVSSIALGEGVSIFADIGLPSLQPVNTLGDGVNKLMLIALLMLANPGAVILIDEIENGFHYSFFPKLWEVIGKLATETNCQVIATSHSYECIQGALGLATDTEDLFRFIRLDRVDGKPVAHVIDNDLFEYAVASEQEVR